MTEEQVETPDKWKAFVERVSDMAREEGLLGIIIAGFEPIDSQGMEIHLSMMNDPDLCQHDKMGMRLKTIEKLTVMAFDASQTGPHFHDDDEHEHVWKGGFDA